MKIENVRCPLKDECGATVCDYEYRELKCSYYYANARPGAELDDQEVSANLDFENVEDKGELVWISIDKLHPHPDNPRKELGDLTELAESIKAKGILQNLTVVPFKSKTNPNFNGTGMYTIIIGHRRHAAAEIAGLAEVPCVITEMTEREQIQTMMLENMQRSDLTIYEQAQGFQMMLDLGETKESIAATTGFSRSTVDRRIKLLNIDGKKFKSAEERGATLEDYIKVAEIENKKIRDKLTDSIGTNNFSWLLREAQNKQIEAQKSPIIKADMKRLGINKNDSLRSWDGDYNRILCISLKEYEGGCIDGKIKDGVEHWWNIVQNDSLSIYVRAPKKKKVVMEKSEAEIHADELREKLKSLTERAYESRKEFCENYTLRGKHLSIFDEWTENFLTERLNGSYSRPDFKLICDILDIEYNKSMYSIDERTLKNALIKHEQNGKLALFMAASGNPGGYYDGNWGEEVPTYAENEKLDMVYEFLEKLGYEMSDEEKALQDGTHELFK